MSLKELYCHYLPLFIDIGARWGGTEQSVLHRSAVGQVLTNILEYQYWTFTVSCILY